jgi:NAD(P)-dependent dehydrogenase (short-subunit alcohol dehydrogenase family)
MSAAPATVVVTGAAGRLGRAVAEAFAADGRWSRPSARATRAA